MDSFRDFASELEPAFGSHAADTPEVLDDAEERRMQVKAYNYWTSLLNGRDFPSIEDLEPSSIAEFAKHSVLIDFTSGPASATTAYVGAALRRECDLDPDSDRLADAPAGSLVARLPSYHDQILDSRAPVGFETSFRNQRGQGHAYRGILMPFSSDGDTIDFVYGVFNWNEVDIVEEAAAPADDVLELSDEPAPQPVAGLDHLMGRSAFGEDDAPIYGEEAEDEQPEAAAFEDEVFELAEPIETPDDVLELDMAAYEPEPHAAETASESSAEDTISAVPFGGFDQTEDTQPEAWLQEFAGYSAPEPVVQDFVADEAPTPVADFTHQPAPEPAPAPLPVATITSVSIGDVPVPIEPVADEEQLSAWQQEAESDHAFADEAGEASLDEWLTAARATAEDAKAADGRSRQALYRALAEAYDFACAAVSAPVEYDRLLEDSGISVQARAPMTAVAKLVFGVDYDKARLTEYAAALSYGARQGIEAGEFLPFIDSMEGGLKAMVEAERRERRPTAQPAPTWRDRAISRLRSAEAQPLGQLAGNGEFALVLVRRDADGSVSPVAAVTDEALLEKAMKKAAH
ncbi:MULTISPECIES: PAS domain-containing protein [Sphingomonas]|uniref:PAS domain-containing protein n=1 Tax=Sphingomonas TaxID=13687 RepID=UPI000DEF2D17|nr:MULTISPECIES: hypothetical protein [Sphingomonas]